MTFNQAMLASRLGIRVRRIDWVGADDWVTNITPDPFNDNYYDCLSSVGYSYKLSKQFSNEAVWEICHESKTS